MKRSIHIEAPVETVFDSFKDPARLWNLMPVRAHLDDVTVTEEGVGTYDSWHGKLAGLPVHGFEVYTDVVPNKHITSRSSNAMVGRWDYDFEPEGSGTKLTMEHHPESIWAFPPLRNLWDLTGVRMTDSFMARVKDTLESQAS